MILVVQELEYKKYEDLLDQMFEQRAQFALKKGWEVIIKDGRERDKYDDLSPAYILSTDRERLKVYGSLRLLPTTGFTLLNEVFAEDFPDAAALSAPSIWDCSRLCVKNWRHGLTSTELMAGIGQTGLKAGITTIVGVFEDGMPEIYKRTEIEHEVLGVSIRQEKKIFAGSFEITPEILQRVEARVALIKKQYPLLQ